MEDVLTADAGLDAGLDTGFEPGDPAGGAPDTAADSTADTGSPEGDAALNPAGGSGRDFKAVENGRLNPKLKAHLDTLRTTDPAAAKAIQKALFLEDTMRAKFGGDLRQIDAMRQTFEQLGGEHGIQEAQQELSGWREFDEQFTAGDPKVIEFMMETPEGKGAFLKIAPSVFEKYREAHPEGYSSYVAGVFAADMQENGIPLLLERLGDFMGAADPKAQELYGQLKAYADRIKGLASTRPKMPEIQKPAIDTERQQFESERQKFVRDQWFSPIKDLRRELYTSTVRKFMPNATNDDFKRIEKYFLPNLTEQMAKKAQGGKTVSDLAEQYFSASQKDGYVRFLTGVYRETVPLAVRITMAEMGLLKKGSPAAAGAAKPGVPPAVRTPSGKPAGASEGFKFVGAKPGIAEVNNVATSPAMWQSGRAILKNGTRVQWKTK